MNDLVTKDHFSDLRTQLAKIKEENKLITFDYETQDKEARSHVQTLRKSKTAINNLHKEKKAFFLAEGRKIDACKNELIADVEEMIKVHTEPLQAIKEKNDAAIELERKKIEIELDWDDAIQMNDFVDREREVLKKEAAFAKMESDRLAKEEAEQAKKDRIEYESRIKKEAEEKAKREAEEALLFEQQEKERLIQESKQREEQVKIDAENAEKKRLSDIEDEKVRVEKARLDAEKKAEREKQEAIDKLKREQQIKESKEAYRLETIRIEDERKARNKSHQKAVNNKVLKKLIELKLPSQQAKDIIEDILKNPIPEISINY